MQLIGYLGVSDKFVAPLIPVLAADGRRYAAFEGISGNLELIVTEADLEFQPLQAEAWMWAEDFRWLTDVLFRVGGEIFCCRRSQRSLLLHGLLCMHQRKLVFDGWRSSLATEIPEASAVIEAILADRDYIFGQDGDGQGRSFLRSQFDLARCGGADFSLLEIGIETNVRLKVPAYARLRNEDFRGRITDQLLAKCAFAILNDVGLDGFTSADVVYACWKRFGGNLTERDIYSALSEIVANQRSQPELTLPNHILDRFSYADFRGKTLAADFPDLDPTAGGFYWGDSEDEHDVEGDLDDDENDEEAT